MRYDCNNRSISFECNQDCSKCNGTRSVEPELLKCTGVVAEDARTASERRGNACGCCERAVFEDVVCSCGADDVPRDVISTLPYSHILLQERHGPFTVRAQTYPVPNPKMSRSGFESSGEKAVQRSLYCGAPFQLLAAIG